MTRTKRNNPFRAILEREALTMEYEEVGDRRQLGTYPGTREPILAATCVCAALHRVLALGLITERECAKAKRYIDKVLGRYTFVTSWLKDVCPAARTELNSLTMEKGWAREQQYRLEWVKHMAQLWDERKI